MILNFTRDSIQVHTKKMPVLITLTALGVLKNLLSLLNVLLDFPIKSAHSSHF